MSLHARVLVVGCGDLGGYLATLLQAKQFDVYALARSRKTIPQVHALQGDVTNLATLDNISQVSADYIVYCVAADQRTDQHYQAQYVDGLRNILHMQAENSRLKGVFFVSSTRVYGQQGEAWITHETLAEPSDFGGERLLEAESLLAQMRCQTVALRLSGIYGPDRLRMINLAKNPAQWPTQNRWTNRIHRDDAAKFIVHLVEQIEAGEQLSKHYIVTDSMPVRQLEVLTWIAAQIGVDTLNNSASRHNSGGKRLSNQAMLATGYRLKYPSFKDGYATLL